MANRRVLAKYLFPLSLIVAWIFDFLFWGKPEGISFPLFVLICLAVGFWLARQAGVKAPRQTLWLLLPIIYFALAPVFRAEPFSNLASHGLSLLLMALFAASFLGGRWAHYNLSDYVAKLSLFAFLGLGSYRQIASEMKSEGDSPSGLKRLAPVGRGLLFALPILLLLGALLSSADPVFGDWLARVFAFLSLEKLAEYLWRGFYIVMLAYLLVGVYTYAITRSRDEKLLGEDKPLFAPMLGFTEAATVLVSVELLFAAFVAVQFRYFFGGNANINFAGYTYAEYARRGFGELVAVALISAGLFVALSLLSRREEKHEQQWFTRLGGILFALVAVILVSAFQRLLLYEDAYGFTRIRTHVHAFMIWLGVLLIALVVLEARGQRRIFTTATMLAAVGFGLSVSLLNVDGFIVSANVERLRLGEDLDIPYLGSLSTDAAPRLLAEFKQSQAKDDSETERSVLAALVCHAWQHDEYAAPAAWQSFTLSRSAAQQAWTIFESSPDFARIELPRSRSSQGEPQVLVDSVAFSCDHPSFLD